jgi:hypothetical protein
MQLEDSLDSIQRRRLRAQLDLADELSNDASAAIDEICLLLPVVDEPMILDRLDQANRPAVCSLLRRLPVTRVIERYLEGR